MTPAAFEQCQNQPKQLKQWKQNKENQTAASSLQKDPRKAGLI